MSTRSIHARVAASVLFLMIIMLLAGCAASGGSSAGYLLEQDYQRMTNAKLTAYEQELSEELARASGSSSPGVSLGLGLGSWGSRAGIGLGVEQSLGGGANAPTELLNRRNAVRGEMRQRGLLPPVGDEN